MAAGAHAGPGARPAVGADAVFLETCYLPAPEAITRRDAGAGDRRRPPGGLLVGPSLAGRRLPRPGWRALPGCRGGPAPLDRHDPAAGHGPPAHHRRQPGLARRRARRDPRPAAHRADAAGRRLRRGTGGPARPGEPRRPARRGHPGHLRAGRPTGRARRVPGQRQPHPGRRRHGRRAPGRWPRTPCSSSSRTTWPATRRSGAARCAPPWARAWPTSTGSSRSCARPASTGRCAWSWPRWARTTSTSWPWSSAAWPGCASASAEELRAAPRHATEEGPMTGSTDDTTRVAIITGGGGGLGGAVARLLAEAGGHRLALVDNRAEALEPVLADVRGRGVEAEPLDRRPRRRRRGGVRRARAPSSASAGSTSWSTPRPSCIARRSTRSRPRTSTMSSTSTPWPRSCCAGRPCPTWPAAAGDGS